MGALRQQMRRGQPRQPCRQRRLHRLGGQIPPHGDAAARRHRRRLAVDAQPDTAEENTVVEVFQKGYTLGDKVLRFAMVKVAN